MNDFFIKYKKFFVYIFIIPVFWVSSSLSVYAYTGDGATVFPLLWHNVPNVMAKSSGWESTLFDVQTEFAATQNAYFSYSPAASDANFLIYYNSSSQLDFNFSQDIYDYYLVATVMGFPDFSFWPDAVSFTSIDSQSNFIDYYLTGVQVYPHTDADTVGFTVFGKFPYINNTNLSWINFVDSSLGSLGSSLRLEGFIVAFPKGSVVGVNDIVSAVNNQTSVIGGKLDNTNDLINNGNSSTGSVVGGFQDSESEFDNVITEYRNVEQIFFDDFRSNQVAISSDITGWSWGGLINCADWVGDTVTDYYNNMGDFRQFIIYPLMLGIALFFLGRGSSIIGHLYRKPTETNTYTVSRSFRDADGSKHTSTTTFRSGGSRR